ncbi:MAG: hypothetical protein H6765_05110 [Candidatus Peribacteria bacterium]|nr:MAG: hypothetical protein H6765_05110 [Candidatus Peribacteria bacterium]
MHVTLVAQDTKPPYLLEDRTKITENDNGSYDVVLLFQDDASVIKSGRIEKNGELILEFDGNLAMFTTDELGEFSYSVVDDADNK